ncbi:hypothetical protein D9756_008247 [Leucocoprinus leucothites]|uniref:Protein kinase domain-containing protein n=1 Tax=Leucocoprinus leucothites TaxID=201217 RepID=A0A8H5FWC8_9AGAR|nr:hypothetical protein D9756_008247 [Leucoagaricus leucothites]
MLRLSTQTYQLQEHLGDRWRRVQEHPHIAAVHFCQALEHARGLPRVSNLPVVLIMPEYQANIMEYVERFHPSYSQRTQWTANALQYLHDNEIVHGNLYPGNILIGDEGNAYVADAMIFTTIIRHLVPDHVASNLRFPNSLPFKTARAIHEKRMRWADPTLHDDLFAFAVTCWSVYAGKDPFPMYGGTIETVVRVGNGKHKELQKVPGMSDGLWRLLRTILAQDILPAKWPSLKELLSQLEANDK